MGDGNILVSLPLKKYRYFLFLFIFLLWKIWRTTGQKINKGTNSVLFLFLFFLLLWDFFQNLAVKRKIKERSPQDSEFSAIFSYLMETRLGVSMP